MSWQETIEFCQKLSEREKLHPCYSRVGNQVLLQMGNGYRLPTDAEWEYACRAGTDSTFWFGSSHDQFSKFVHFYEDKQVGRTHAVGELKANPFGLFDMHGNVWEFVQDGWHPTTYSRFANGSVVDPIGAPSLSDLRPIRGGSWLDVPSTSTSGTRMAVSANDRSLNNVGFRVLLSIAAVKAALANPVQAEAPPMSWKHRRLAPCRSPNHQCQSGKLFRASSSVICPVRICTRTSSFQPHRRRFMAALLPLPFCLSSESVKRFSQAKFSRWDSSRLRDSSSRQVMSRHQWQVFSMAQCRPTARAKRLTPMARLLMKWRVSASPTFWRAWLQPLLDSLTRH